MEIRIALPSSSYYQGKRPTAFPNGGPRSGIVHREPQWASRCLLLIPNASGKRPAITDDRQGHRI